MPRKVISKSEQSEPVSIPPKSEPHIIEQEAVHIGSPSKNKWVDHVKSVASKNGLTYRQALSVAKETYNRN